MAFNPLKEKGMPLEKQAMNWESMNAYTYNKDEVHPYTKCRIILMNGIEVESAMFLHEFNRKEKRPDVKQRIAMIRRMEQQQQKAVNGMVPGEESTLENTIGYEQVAVDLTAFLARTATDPYLKAVLDFALLEDFDHLYRYANLLEMLEGKQAEKLVRDLTEIIPGRPTFLEHRHPFDSIRKPLNKKTADPKDILYIHTIVSGEQQTMNFYMNQANRYTDKLARGLYTEIGMVEEQHVSQYESLMDPGMSWFEMDAWHHYNECYLYHSFMEQEPDPKVKKIWEMCLGMELGHLKESVELLKEYDRKDPEEFLPKHLPAPLVFESNVDYVREVLDTQLNLTAVETEFSPIDEIEPDHRYFAYQKMVNGAWIPSEEVIKEHQEKLGADYRLELSDEDFGENVHPIGYYKEKSQMAQSNEIFNILKTEHEEVNVVFDKLEGKPDRNIFTLLETDLTLHMEGEEKIVYPRLKEFKETRDLTMDGIEEHKEAKEILKELDKIPFGNKEWQSKLGKLQETIEHHVEEEEHELFEKARLVLKRDETEQMGKAYQSEKKKQLKKAG